MWTRREFFRGASLGVGGLFFSPFLSQLEAKSSAKPMRLVFLLQGNGLYPDQIQPQGIERPQAKPPTPASLISSVQGRPPPRSQLFPCATQFLAPRAGPRGGAGAAASAGGPPKQALRSTSLKASTCEID